MIDLSHADCRRAAALVIHRTRRDLAGVQVVFDEASEANRAKELLAAVVGAYGTLAEELRSVSGQTLIRKFLCECSTASDPYVRRASLLIVGRYSGQPAFDELLGEVNEAPDGPTRLVGAVADLWSSLLPELCSEYGLSHLQAWTARIAESESEGA